MTLDNANRTGSSTDFVIANPDFNNEKNAKVLGQVSPSESQLDAAAGPLEIGALSVSFRYYDEAGRFYETTSKHTFENNQTSRFTNVPASQFPQTVANVGSRFMR